MSGNIEVTEVRVQALPGGEISECIYEALALSFNEKRTVVLNHNGKLFTCDHKTAMKAVWATERKAESEAHA